MPSASFQRILLAVFALSLFLAAGLLFYIQPMIGKMLLPRAGGAPAVWNVTMAFFQLALLAGYVLAHGLSRLPVRLHGLIYLLALAGAWFALPLALPEGWQMPSEGAQSLAILLLLLQTAAIPFVALSLSAPTLQRLFTASGHPQSHDPYFLYAASNLGSFAGLLAYPLLVEPLLSVREQSLFWQQGFIALLGIVVLVQLLLLKTTPATTASAGVAAPAVKPDWRRRGYWVLLAFVPSSLTLGVTTYITTDIAATPLLWVLTLALYLLTYIIAFARRGEGLRQWALHWAPWFGAVAAATQMVSIPLPWPVIALHVTAFFLLALACHSLLAKDRPEASQLTGFYLCLSVGGALGGSFNAFVAPVAFNMLLEYPLVLLLALGLAFPAQAFLLNDTKRQYVAFGLLALILLVVLELAFELLGSPFVLSFMLASFVAGVLILLRPKRQLYAVTATVVLAAIASSGVFHNKIFSDRDFFGVVSVMDRQDAASGQTLRYLMHGTTIHGVQIIAPEEVAIAQGYYTPEGPVGSLFATLKPDQVLAIGLGTGAINCYARPDQRFHFIEIDPLVVEVARQQFSFLSKCPEPEITIADGRLALKNETRRYDLIVLDAFSSDSVPAHLLTREAFQLYLNHLNPGGVIAMHISNRFFDLAPMLTPLGHELGLSVVSALSLRDTIEPKRAHAPTEWMAMAPDPARTQMLLEADPQLWRTPDTNRSVTPWTDDFSNLLSVFKIGRQ
jgi:hypothetical protein